MAITLNECVGLGPSLIGAKLCLNMIVKNEAHCIERCLNSVKPFIQSWCIVDTGSTDGTQGVIRRVMGSIPGKLVESPWPSGEPFRFDKARNHAWGEALELGSHLLIIDADEEYKPSPNGSLDPEPYVITIDVEHGKQILPRTFIVRADSPYRWSGRLHEDLPAGLPRAHAVGHRILSHFDGARSKDPEKFRRDVAVLEEMLKESPDDPKNLYYLGVALRAGRDAHKAYGVFDRLASARPSTPEGWASRVEMAQIAHGVGDFDLALSGYLQAMELRPNRAEVSGKLTALLNWHGMPRMAASFGHIASSLPVPSDDRFLLDEAWYRWKAKHQWAIALANLGQRDKALDLLREIEPLADEDQDTIRKDIAVLLG